MPILSIIKENKVDWSRFLELTSCPAVYGDGKPCEGTLERVHDGLQCSRGSHLYKLHEDFGFPLFTPRSSEEIKADHYEDPAYRYAELYTGIWGFGYYFSGRGESESVYRTVNELIFSTPLKDEEQLRILDIGCGVGRITCDVARHYQNALVVGVELSKRMIEQAYRLLVGDPSKRMIEVSLEKEGLGVVSAPSFGLTNIFLAQGSALTLPFASNQFDLVTSTNLIDRVSEPEKMISEAVRVLKPGGYFILVDPFNWLQPQLWNRARTMDQFKALLTQNKLEIDQAFDGLAYKELLDVRGGHLNWSVGVVRAIKTE
jgi:ubiquinone/menaquinone biosynthesis C-methylase UbiE